MSISTQKDNYIWNLGYIINYGHIEYVNIELMINGKYLSDLINEDIASNEEKEIYNNINNIESYILQKQKFSLPSEYKNIKPYIFLNSNFDEINNLENY